MATLLDLANAGRKVKVGDNEIEVFGVSVEAVVALLVRFPAIMKRLVGTTEEAEIDGATMLALAPTAVAAFIAACCGQAGDKEAEKAAARLSIEAQLNIIEAGMKLTFPSGVGPFVAKLKGLGVLAQAEEASLRPSQKASSNLKKEDTKTS